MTQAKQPVEKSDGLHALSPADSKKLLRMAGIAESILREKYAVRTEDGTFSYNYAEAFPEIISAIQRRRYNLAKASSTANAIINRGYWLVTLIDNYTPPSARVGYSLSYRLPDSELLDFDNSATILYEQCHSIYDLGSIEEHLGTIRDELVLSKVLPKEISASYISYQEWYAVTLVAIICESALHPEAEIEEIPGFSAVTSSPFTNALTTTRQGHIAYKDEFTGDTTFDGISVSITVSGEDITSVSLDSPNADKMLKQCINKALVGGFEDKTVKVTLAEYMEARGLRDKKEARKTLRSALDTIYAVSINGETRFDSFTRVRIAQEVSYTDGVARVTFTDRFFTHLASTKQIAYVPDALLTIPNDRSNSYWIFEAFEQHKRRNAGSSHNIENKLATRSLLNRCSFPSIEEIPKGLTKRKITEPFDKCLQYLRDVSNVFSEYRYIYASAASKGKSSELTSEDAERMWYDFELFSSLIVEVVWTQEPPNRQHLVERKQARKKTGSKRRGRPKKSE